MKYTASALLTLALSVTVSADACSDACTAAHEKCQTAPDANQSTCAAEYAACLGYNPYEPSYVSPTACSATATASVTASVTATVTASATVTGTPDACAESCISSHDACAAAPTANEAVCAASFAGCLGYNPYDPSYVAPTACSATSMTAPTTTAVATGKPNACAAACIKAHEKCQGQPDANQSTCAAEFAACLGYNPYSPSYVAPTACSTTATTAAATTPVYVTAAGDRMQPLMGLLALGAAAIL